MAIDLFQNSLRMAAMVDLLGWTVVHWKFWLRERNMAATHTRNATPAQMALTVPSPSLSIRTCAMASPNAAIWVWLGGPSTDLVASMCTPIMSTLDINVSQMLVSWMIDDSDFHWWKWTEQIQMKRFLKCASIMHAYALCINSLLKNGLNLFPIKLLNF